MRALYLIFILCSSLYADSTAIINNAMKSVVNLYAFGNHKHDHTLGSGIIISKDGYLITNAHVVNNFHNIIATLEDKNYFKAKLVGIDNDSDIAILKINAENLNPLSISYKPLSIGQHVYAIGNPFGFNHSVTSGIISALGRKIGLLKYENFIQIDAPINPGNSGGALVDEQGKLIGINSAIFSKTGANNGVGFAIPTVIFDPITKQLIQHGSIKRGLLGVYVQELTPKLASALKLKTLSGVLITNIMPNSNAERIGLKRFDIIKSINKQNVNSFIDLQSITSTIRIESKLDINIVRNGQEMLVSGIQKFTDMPVKKNLLSGLRLAPKQYWDEEENLVTGLEVTYIDEDSKAWMADLRSGDIITSINNQPIQTLEAIKTIYDKNGSGILMLVKRHKIDRVIYVQ